jgi:hypothetical protein
MRGISRMRLSAARRLKLCAAVHHRVWAALAAARDALRKSDAGVPEPAAQRELLDLADQLATVLIGGYQLAVAADYRADGSHGRAERQRILEASVHALELIHLQQRLRALRFQALPAGHWQTANTLFCVLCRSHQQETLVPALCDDRLLVTADGSIHALRLFAAIQGFGLFDVFSWSKRQQRLLDTYSATVQAAVAVTYAPAQITGRDIRFSHAYQAAPPSATPPADAAHRILIDFTNLADAVRTDKEAGRYASMHQAGGTSSSLLGLPPLARRPIMRAMLRDLQHERPLVLPDVTDAGRCDFRLETGMERVKQHLQALFAGDTDKREQLLRSGALAGRSSTMGDDAAGNGDTDWRVLLQSEHHVLVQTRETRHTKPIGLGALAVFGVGDEGFARPLLGSVTRIVRPRTDSLYVEIKQIARFAAIVHIVATFGADSGRVPRGGQIPCLLAYDDSLGWCIIASQRNSLPVGCPIQIRTRRLQVETRLRTLREITPSFLMFQLDALNPRLGSPSYPSARKRHRHGRLVAASHLRAVTEPNDDPRRRRRNAS